MVVAESSMTLSQFIEHPLTTTIAGVLVSLLLAQAGALVMLIVKNRGDIRAQGQINENQEQINQNLTDLVYRFDEARKEDRRELLAARQRDRDEILRLVELSTQRIERVEEFLMNGGRALGVDGR